MDIEKIIDGNTGIYKIKGNVDTQTAPELQVILDDEINNGIIKLTLDLSEVEYMSSAGLRTVLYIQKKIKATPESEMTITNVQDAVMEVFEVTGFTEFLDIK